MTTVVPKRLTCKNGRQVFLREATSEDASGLLDLARQLLSDGEGQIRLPGEASRTELEEQSWIRKHQEHPDWLLLVVEHEGSLIGCLDFSSGSVSRLSHRGVFGMGVKPGWRSNGIGRELLGMLLDWAEANPNLEKIGLAVVATNAKAIALYEKMGFREEGRRLREVKMEDGSYVDDLLMYRFV